MEMILVSSNDVILTTECKSFDFNSPPFDPIEFSQSLVKTMRDSNGIGLSANQVGYSYRVFAMRGDPNRVVFNPRIVSHGEEQVYVSEGCLSFPGLNVNIKRMASIRVRYQQPTGEVITENFTGLSARVFQHEHDHIDGILFYNRATLFHKEKAFRKWKKYRRSLNTSKIAAYK